MSFGRGTAIREFLLLDCYQLEDVCCLRFCQFIANHRKSRRRRPTMPQQVEHATVMTLDSITEHDVGRKLRVAGRMLTYDPESALVLLHDASSALLVDATLCLDLEAMHSVFSPPSERSKNPNVDHNWALQRKSHVWVVGYLERAEDELPIPMLPAYLPAPDINPSIFIHALIISPAKDLDIVRLRAALTAMAEVPPTPYPV